MPFRISRLGYVEVKVLNLDDALDFYTKCPRLDPS
jgi:hypothetical protein